MDSLCASGSHQAPGPHRDSRVQEVCVRVCSHGQVRGQVLHRQGYEVIQDGSAYKHQASCMLHMFTRMSVCI